MSTARSYISSTMTSATSRFRALRANIDETVHLVVITEQGEKRNHP